MLAPFVIRYLPLLAAAFFASVTLLAILLPVPFNRLAADDFCYNQLVLAKGLLGAQWEMYSGWTGRYTATFLQMVVGLFSRGSGHLGWYSALSFAGLFGGLVFVLRAFGRGPRLLLASAVAMGFLFVLTPDKKESWFWLAGSATYLWPGILGFVSLGIALHAFEGRKALGIAAICTALATACNEPFGLLAVVTLGCAAVAGWWRRAPWRWHAWINALAAGASFIVMYLAPGNGTRAQNFDSPGYPEAIARSFWHARSLLADVFLSHGGAIVGVLVILALLLHPRDDATEPLGGRLVAESLAGIIAAGTLLFAGAALYSLPGAKFIGWLPPPRSHMTLVLFAFPLALFLVAKVVRPLLRVPHVRLAALGIATLLLTDVSVDNWDLLPKQTGLASDYAASFDSMYGRLTDLRGTAEPIVVDPLPESGPLHTTRLERNGAYWENACVADAFELYGGVTVP